MHWREAVLVVATTVLTLIVLEIGYRLYQYQTLPGRLFALVDAQLPTNHGARPGNDATQVHVPDLHTGYTYAPNYQGARGHPWHSRWRTNSHGHVSQFEYPQQKPPGEYRIAVVGDSLTANITNNVRWTERLEELLNASAKWRQETGNKFTRVINFGVDGMGMIQFSAMVRHHAMAFEPDLTIVNFISDSILRRLRYAGVPVSHGGRNETIRTYVRRNYLDRIDWFNSCPELIGATIGRGRVRGCMLPLDAREILATEPSFRFSDRAEALQTGIAAAKDVLLASANVLFLQMPTFHELENQADPLRDDLVAELRAAVPNAKIVSMRPHMERLLEGKLLRDRPDLTGKSLTQITQLPEDQRLEIYRWFFLPEDVHYTDYGTSLYAQEVAKHLIDLGPRAASERGALRSQGN